LHITYSVIGSFVYRHITSSHAVIIFEYNAVWDFSRMKVFYAFLTVTAAYHFVLTVAVF